MNRHTFTLRRVFDVQPNPRRWFHGTTDFSFETEDRQRVIAVQVKGRPRLQVGDRITAILEKPDDWTTLLAWHNATSGETLRNFIQPALVLTVALITVSWSALAWLHEAPLPWLPLLLMLFSVPGWIRNERLVRSALRQPGTPGVA